MTQQSDNEKDSNSPGMRIDIGHLSATGNVVISGRDGSVYVNTGGNVDQQSQQVITVGGIETTQQELDKLMAKIRSVDDAIVGSDLDDDSKEAAELDLKILEEQLTASKKPNAKVVVKTARALYRLSPVLASAIFALFGEPLAAQIMAGVGGLAIQFLEALMKRHTSK